MFTELICRKKDHWVNNPVWMFEIEAGRTQFIYADVTDDDGYYELHLIDQAQFDWIFEIVALGDEQNSCPFSVECVDNSEYEDYLTVGYAYKVVDIVGSPPPMLTCYVIEHDDIGNRKAAFNKVRFVKL